MPLQRTTFENIVATGKIAHDETFLLLPQSFQLYIFNNLTLIHGDFLGFCQYVFIVFICRFVVFEKDLKYCFKLDYSVRVLG